MYLIILGLVYDRRMAGRPKANLELTKTQRRELERMARAGTSEKRMVFRARLILECATGAGCNLAPTEYASPCGQLTTGNSSYLRSFWRPYRARWRDG